MQTDDPTQMKRRRVTAQMVADAAGVSRSAVSRAFTEGAYVDAGKRNHIRDVADRLGYRPNALAAGLQAGQSNLIAIFVGDMRNSYDMEFVRQLVQALNAREKCPVLIDGAGGCENPATLSALRYPLDALVLRSGSMPATLVAQCTQFGIPMIASGRPVTAPGVDTVCCLNAEGTRAMTRLLLSRGRRRFGLIGGPAAFHSSAERRDGILSALAEAGLAPVVERTGDYTVEGGHATARALLAAHDIDALVCANDAMAIGALSAAREMGRAVPGDLAVTGFDDIAMAAWPSFGLTTVRNPIDASVQQIIALLDSRLADPGRENRTVHIDPEVIPRQTH